MRYGQIWAKTSYRCFIFNHIKELFDAAAFMFHIIVIVMIGSWCALPLSITFVLQFVICIIHYYFVSRPTSMLWIKAMMLKLQQTKGWQTVPYNKNHLGIGNRGHECIGNYVCYNAHCTRLLACSELYHNYCPNIRGGLRRTTLAIACKLRTTFDRPRMSSRNIDLHGVRCDTGRGEVRPSCAYL
jgi:hypothetical protein